MNSKIFKAHTLTEVVSPSNSELQIRKISRGKSTSFKDSNFEPSQKIDGAIKELLTEQEENLINLLPAETRELARTDKSYRDSLIVLYLEPKVEPSTVPNESSFNPYKELLNNNHPETFNPKKLPEGENNPYRKLLESGLKE